MLPQPEDADRKPHIPVLLNPILKAVAPVRGVWLDGTFGAGGYSRGLLAAGADQVIGVDRDPLAFQMAAPWAGEYGNRLRLVQGTFSNLDTLAGEPLDPGDRKEDWREGRDVARWHRPRAPTP